jgi:predicted MPP superfamily phosphohydrolase
MILWLFLFFGLIAYALAEGCLAIRDYPIAMYVYLGVFLFFFVGTIVSVWLSRRMPFALGRLLAVVFSPFLMIFINLSICFGLIDIVRIINLIAKFSSDDLRDVRVWWFVASLSLVIVLYVIGYINFQCPRIVRLEISNYDCPLQHRQLSIVAASDLHLGFVIGKRKLRKWVQMINSLSPDLVLLVGDIADSVVEPIIHQSLHDELNSLLSTFGVFAVSGNHEYHGGQPARFEEYLKRMTRIHYLRDSSELVQDSFYVVGRDDRMNPCRRSVGELVSDLDRTKPIILMDHQPYDLSVTADHAVTLQVSGHTHGGQFFPGPLFARMVFEKTHGYSRIRNTHFYVSSGLGLLGPQCRLGSNSEIVCIRLNY